MTTGLFTPQRQRRLLRGLANRCQEGVRKWETLGDKHARQVSDLVTHQQREKKKIQSQSEAELRAYLKQWDASDEKITAAYEENMLNTRIDLSRMSHEFRRRHRQGMAEIENRYAESKQNATKQYESRKPIPGKQKARDNNRLNQGWNAVNAQLEIAREIALKRLQKLDEPPSTPSEFEKPASVEEALKMLEGHVAGCEEKIASLGDDFAIRFIESAKPAAVMFLSLVLWVGGVFLLGFQGPMAIGLYVASIIVAMITGFICFAIFTPRVKRVTRERYPLIEQHAVDAVAVVKDGQERATEAANELAQKIKDEYSTAMRRAEETKKQQTEAFEKQLKKDQEDREKALRSRLVELEEAYNEEFSHLEGNGSAEFGGMSQEHQKQLDQASERRAATRSQLANQQRDEDETVARRLRDGLSRGLGRIDAATSQVQRIYPEWNDVVAGEMATAESLELAPVGYLNVANFLKKSVSIASSESTADKRTPLKVGSKDKGGSKDYVRTGMAIEETLPAQLPEQLPVALTSFQHSGLLIDCPGGNSEAVSELVRAFLWRLMTAIQPGNLRLTLLDPIGRGQTFSSLMGLADHDPNLVGHRAWTQPNQIETRLAELTQHMEDVLQTYLRDVYETIDEYNAQAGSMAEPYRVVAAVGIPAGLTTTGYDCLRALMENGRRCGIITVLVRDPDEDWPHDFAALPLDRLLHLKVDKDGQIRHTDPLLSEMPLDIIEPPPSRITPKLIQTVGKQAVDGRRVEIPFDDVMPASMYNEGDSSDGLDIPLGQQGAGRQLRMQLGEGVRQHMLVAGKTGSGKSTLLHTIITAGALRYTPDELGVYLLDFKKGVEFKVYADGNLPHARVIGIESEREFGRSVLERLDRELQHRGELFRAAGVQEVGEYRRATGEKMPRLMLVVDEFQELFIRDDRISQDCTMLLDRLVRQGRSFGMHVILSSQSLAGAYSLPRNTLGQMAVRVALQCSESDALVILAEDNSAARLLGRPGEAIYNDAGGLIEGNQPFQVGWLDHGRHQDLLSEIAERYPEAYSQYGQPVIFEGNRPARWSAAAADDALRSTYNEKGVSEEGFAGLLGEAIAIGPPVTLQLQPHPGRNVLVIGDADHTREVLGVTIPAFYGGALSKGQKLRVISLDGRRVGGEEMSAAEFAQQAGVPIQHAKPRDADKVLAEISELVEQRNQLDNPEDESPILLIVDPLERFRDLRQDDSAFSFSLDSPSAKQTASTLLQTILRDGPPAAVHTILCCGGAETVNRWLPRQSQHDLELYILGQMSVSDSSQLIDSPDAGRLSPASMLIYDDSTGNSEKFRVYDLPGPSEMQGWIETQIKG